MNETERSASASTKEWKVAMQREVYVQHFTKHEASSHVLMVQSCFSSLLWILNTTLATVVLTMKQL